jgi:hypothetical protein
MGGVAVGADTLLGGLGGLHLHPHLLGDRRIIHGLLYLDGSVGLLHLYRHSPDTALDLPVG